MPTVKISELSAIPVIQGNVIVPVVGNIDGSFTTVKANVDQIRLFILGDLTTSDLANLSSNVNTLFSNAAIQSSNIAQLFANAGAQSAQLTSLEANAAIQSGQITVVQNNLNAANTAMKAYVDQQVADILDTTVFTGNISVGNLTISNVENVTKLYATNTNGNITLVPNGIGVVDVSAKNISNLSDPIEGQDAVTLSYLLNSLSTAVTNLVLDDTEVVITDDGVSEGKIVLQVDGALVQQINPANVTIFGNVFAGGNLIYSLGSDEALWNSLYVGNIYFGNSDELNLTDGNLLINGDNLSEKIAYSLANNQTQHESILDIQANISALYSNAAVQNQTLVNLDAFASANASNIAILQSNAGLQSGQIATVQTNLNLANLAMKAYVDNEIANLTFNAAVQSFQITSVQANVVTANTAMKGYVDNQVTLLTANAAIQAGQIATTDNNIVVANLAMKGYVDNQVTLLTANAAVQAGQIGDAFTAISTANIAMLGYVNSGNAAMQAYVDQNFISLTSNAAIQAGLIAALESNAAVQAGLITALGSNAAVQAGLIAALESNAAVQAGSISALESNAAVQAGQITSAQNSVVTANTAMKGYVDGLIATISGNANIQLNSIESLTSNAAFQAGEIQQLQANAAFQSGQIASLSATTVSQNGLITNLQSNILTQSSQITSLEANAAVQAGNIAALFANAAVQAGLISQLDITANIKTSSYLPVYGGNILVSGITNSNPNGFGNIGNIASRFNTVFAVATSARYADLAEKYESDAPYQPGTVVIFGGEKEISISDTSHDHRIAGVVSTNPAYLMNDEVIGVAVALSGKVPCKVVGTIEKGDLLVQSSIGGIACKMDLSQWQPGCVIGKALENYNSAAPGIINISVMR